MTIYPACVIHQYGATFFLGISEADRDGRIATWCRDWWQQEHVPGEPPKSDSSAIRRYFEHVLTDTLWIGEPEGVRSATLSGCMERTDWRMLAQQKLSLIKLISTEDATAWADEHLNGLLHWIDAIQDAAAAEGHPVVWLDGSKP